MEDTMIFQVTRKPRASREPSAMAKPSDRACWAALQRRDRAFDGRFVFGVSTTGVYCRPSCAAKHPLRGNVRFFDTPEAAERAAFRACKRCRPLEAAAPVAPDAERVRAACAYIRAHATGRVTLRQLSARAGVSPFHFQRTFKAAVGLTPQQYLQACRLGRLKTELRSTASITDAAYASGYGSSSRMYERADANLGMTPAAYRAGGRGLTIACASAATPLGRLMMGATDRGVCFVQFGGSDEALLDAIAREFPSAQVTPLRRPYPPLFGVWMAAVLGHLQELPDRPDVPLDVRATAFQTRVWRYLQGVPRGGVRSYADVARGIGRPSAVRAVARACASNPVALVVPCHRVIRGDGSLGGYRWGLARKRALLELERSRA
jgi:AraC family transcriptional regulator of adaptative response/methylated-DNA-[protein]-cysteine methyltransferase